MPKRVCRSCANWQHSPAICEENATIRTGFCKAIETYAKDDALIEICADGGATVYTSPKFGCNLWTRKN